MEEQKSFWGLVIEQGKQYKQTPAFNFHVSRAVLDLEGYDKEPVSVKVQVENREFILCNLTENESQANLDLIFSEGEKIKFFTVGGKANVHLTGYLMPEEDLSPFDDDEFSDEDASEDEQVLMNTLNNMKRKNTETVKLTGKDSKKLKTDDKVAVEANAKQQKVVDVDPKQLLNKKDNKQDNQQNKKKDGQPQQQQKNKVQMNNKLATKGLEIDSDSDDNDDDLSIDEDGESVDLNAMMDEEDSDLIDEDLDSDDDLESDDAAEIEAKLNKNKNKAKKPNMMQNQTNKPQQQNDQKNKQQNKPIQNLGNKQHQQKNGPFQQMNKNQHTPNQNKNQQNTPNQNKNQQKPHQQTPFHQNKNSNKKNQGTPFQSGNKNKSFGSQKKQAKKAFN